MVRSEDWIGLHVFYSDDMDALLTGCVAPLVADLRRRAVLDRYFFLRYWLEGPHVRLRLRPVAGAERTVTDVATRAVRSFLTEHPSVARPDGEIAAAQPAMARREFPEAELIDTYGPNIEIPLRPDNSYPIIDYHPEYARYGGTAGVDLAEWHFEQSSDLVLALLGRGTVSELGHRHQIASKLMAVMTLVLTRDRARAGAFLAQYGRQARWDGPADAVTRPAGAPARAQVDQLCAALLDSPPPVDPRGPVSGWWAHCVQLRDKIAERGGEFTFTGGSASEALLASFLHMTNNRLGIPISSEAALAETVHDAFSGMSAR